MAKQVDFYLISNQVPDARYKLASRLCNKMQRLDKMALVVTDDDSCCQQLGQLLWTFSDTSFVAHEQLSEEPASRIQIGPSAEVTPTVLARDYDVLINLCSKMPLFNLQFDRIAEIVDATDSAKAAARQRFKDYRNEGFELKIHNIEL